MTLSDDDLSRFLVSGDGSAGRDASRPAPTRVLSPSERRAETTTRVARDATDAETERRRTKVAALKAERLARDAAQEPVAPPAKPARRPKRSA